MSLKGKIVGVGKMTAGRLGAIGISSEIDLDNYIMTHDATEVRNMVRQVTLNQRAGQCIEGYIVRRYNKRAYDGLVNYINEFAPEKSSLLFHANSWRLTDPKRLVFRQRGRGHGTVCEEVEWDPGLPYEATQDTIGTLGALNYPWDGHIGYGKSCKPHGTSAERHLQIMNDRRYSARKKYNCKCFRSKSTCSDFDVLVNPDAAELRVGTGKPLCRWVNDRCENIG